MGKVDREKFKSDARRGRRRGGKFSSWRDAGETVGFIHPRLGLWERYSHGTLPSFEEQDDGTFMVRRRSIICHGQSPGDVPNSGCPTCLLQEFAQQKIAEGADEQEAILDVGKGRDRIAYTLADLAGDAGYRNDPAARKQVVFAWIPRDAEFDDLKDAVEIITGPQSLGSRIIEVIEDEIKERGEVAGDIEVPEGFELRLRKGSLVLESDDGEEVKWAPFGFKLKYKKNETAQNKYGAFKMDRDLCAVTPEIAQVMLADSEDLEIDLEAMCSPTTVERQMEIIKSSWASRAIPFDEFEEFVEAGGNGGKARRNDSGGKKPRTAGKSGSTRAKPEGNKAFCPECGTENRKGAKFCSGCGSKLGGGSGAAEEESKPEKSAGGGKTVLCPECGEQVVPMRPSGRCPECGVKLKQNDVDEDDVPF